MSRSSSLRLALAAALVAASSTAAQAQTRTWNLVTGTTAGTCVSVTSGGVANVSYNCVSTTGSTTPTLTAAGLSAAGSAATSAVTYGVLTNQGSNGVGVGSAGEGYGAATSGNGDHAIDNGNTNGFDLLYLGFTSEQALNSVTFGWTGLDADFQVLRWTNTAAAPTLTSTTTVGSLVAPGAWQVVATVDGRTSTGGNDADVTYAFNAGGASSAHWLISAYNPGLGSATFATGGADQFKVRSVTGTAPTNVVPEPSTYALMGTGLAGLLAAARRRRAALGA